MSEKRDYSVTLGKDLKSILEECRFENDMEVDYIPTGAKLWDDTKLGSKLSPVASFPMVYIHKGFRKVYRGSIPNLMALFSICCNQIPTMIGNLAEEHKRIREEKTNDEKRISESEAKGIAELTQTLKEIGYSPVQIRHRIDKLIENGKLAMDAEKKFNGVK